MINVNFVNMLADKIFSKEINPKTELPFTIDDVKKEEYKPYILDRINLLEEAKKEQEESGKNAF